MILTTWLEIPSLTQTRERDAKTWMYFCALPLSLSGCGFPPVSEFILAIFCGGARARVNWIVSGLVNIWLSRFVGKPANTPLPGGPAAPGRRKKPLRPLAYRDFSAWVISWYEHTHARIVVVFALSVKNCGVNTRTDDFQCESIRRSRRLSTWLTPNHNRVALNFGALPDEFKNRCDRVPNASIYYSIDWLL